MYILIAAITRFLKSVFAPNVGQIYGSNIWVSSTGRGTCLVSEN